MATGTQFTEEKIISWDDLHDRANNSIIRSVYRGHSRSDWDLSPSFVRECKRIPVLESTWISVEYRMLREFQRAAHLYEPNLPKPDDHIGWLAFMQHYGAPTRLLDFTYSLYVACFFAVMSDSGDSCVWAINDEWLREKVKYEADVTRSYSMLRDDELRAQNCGANKFLSRIYNENCGGGNQFKNVPLGVFMLEPERQTERLGNQQGLFLMQKNIHSSFLDNLVFTDALPEQAIEFAGNPADFIRKLIIPEDIRRHGLSVLRSMNVTAESLFPGIEGYSKAVMQKVLGF